MRAGGFDVIPGGLPLTSDKIHYVNSWIWRRAQGTGRNSPSHPSRASASRRCRGRIAADAIRGRARAGRLFPSPSLCATSDWRERREPTSQDSLGSTIGRPDDSQYVRVGRRSNSVGTARPHYRHRSSRLFSRYSHSASTSSPSRSSNESPDTTLVLSHEQIELLERYSVDFRCRHVESSRPGELLNQDTFWEHSRAWARWTRL